jgi:hypothetical protein
MTRTERASFPRALEKDRHDSRSGLDKHIAKNGAGAHGWGSVADELDHEAFAYDDEPGASFDAAVKEPTTAVDVPRSKDVAYTEEERESAREFRKHALKDGVWRPFMATLVDIDVL